MSTKRADVGTHMGSCSHISTMRNFKHYF
jgi:hypothetical protein